MKAYLSERNAGYDVWLCEDGSGLVSKIQYDQTSDQLIGMVLPLDESNGCPKRYVYTARDQEEITKFMLHSKSTHVYIVMAVPLKEGVAPYIFQLFGTDNRFKASDVIKRWNYTIQSLKRYLEFQHTIHIAIYFRFCFIVNFAILNSILDLESMYMGYRLTETRDS